MDKVIRDGKVAVLYSPGYGSGWYSYHKVRELLYHPHIVELVEQGRREDITEDLVKGLGFANVYCGGAEDLRIEWIPEGVQFKISEYDGFESFLFEEEWLTA
jgi:hypothetical protein